MNFKAKLALQHKRCKSLHIASITLTKTLFLRLSSIGDIILTTPFIRVWKNTHPTSELHFVTREEYADLLIHHPSVDHVHTLDRERGFAGLLALRRALFDERFTFVFDLHRTLKTRILTLGYPAERRAVKKLRLEKLLLVQLKINRMRNIPPIAERYMTIAIEFGITPDGKGPEIFFPDSVRTHALNTLRHLTWNGKAAIALCPGARHFTKRWPLDKYHVLCRQLAREHDMQILVFGGNDDRELGASLANANEHVVNLCGELNLLETAAALDVCRLAITNDSGLMHIATARRIPVVAIFGSTVREFGFFPYNTMSIVLETSGLQCRPCTHIGRSSCPKGHFRCMNEITPQHVFEAVQSLLQ